MVLSHALQDGFEGFRRSLTLSHPRPLRIYVSFSCVNIHTQFISVAAAECPVRQDRAHSHRRAAVSLSRSPSKI